MQDKGEYWLAYRIDENVLDKRPLSQSRVEHIGTGAGMSKRLGVNRRGVINPSFSVISYTHNILCSHRAIGSFECNGIDYTRTQNKKALRPDASTYALQEGSLVVRAMACISPKSHAELPGC